MSYSDPMQLFKILKEQTKTTTQSNGVFGNPNILKFQKNKTYSLRLLWLPSEKRQYPMINQYVHRIWDENAVGSKDVVVQCPTSQYDMDNGGFNVCPICSSMSKLYREIQNGSSSAKELYDKFKRTLQGYVPVYVVNGPAEDLHKVKIMHYTISFKRYFDLKIFGIQADKPKNGEEVQSIDESNCVGINAFMYYDPKKDKVITNGYNFMVSVGSKKVPINGRTVEMNDYKLDFSMKPTDITDFDGVEITAEYFKGLSDLLHFDKDFYIMSDIEKINNFKLKYIDGVDTVEEKTEAEDEDETPMMKPAPAKPAAKAEVIEEVEEQPAEENETLDEEDSSEDIDIDALLKDI